MNTSNGCKYFHPELVRGNVSATVKNNTEDLEKDSLDVEHERCLFGLSCRYVNTPKGCLFFHPEKTTNAGAPGLG